jgi:hypothetical protein
VVLVVVKAVPVLVTVVVIVSVIVMLGAAVGISDEVCAVLVAVVEDGALVVVAEYTDLATAVVKESDVTDSVLLASDPVPVVVVRETVVLGAFVEL